MATPIDTAAAATVGVVDSRGRNVSVGYKAQPQQAQWICAQRRPQAVLGAAECTASAGCEVAGYRPVLPDSAVHY